MMEVGEKRGGEEYTVLRGVTSFPASSSSSAAYIALRYYPFPIETVPSRVGRIYLLYFFLPGIQLVQWRKLREFDNRVRDLKDLGGGDSLLEWIC